VSFDHADFDEAVAARSTASSAGAPFIAVSATRADCADHFADAVAAGEMIHFNAHGAARFLLSREVKRAGYKVVLAGEGADELVAGYDFSSEALRCLPEKERTNSSRDMTFRLKPCAVLRPQPDGFNGGRCYSKVCSGREPKPIDSSEVFRRGSREPAALLESDLICISPWRKNSG
jgi:asparagine synthetase B (glutamine-hydrolysing)